ncbi:hypothetical protein MTO96_001119 [Rhipicephalus appendiculatus]
MSGRQKRSALVAWLYLRPWEEGWKPPAHVDVRGDASGQPGAQGPLRGPARSQWWVPAGCALADDQDPGAEATRDVSEKGNKTNKLGRRFLSTRRLLAERPCLPGVADAVRARRPGAERRQLCLLASLSADGGVKEAALTPAAFEHGPLGASDSGCVSLQVAH